MSANDTPESTNEPLAVDIPVEDAVPAVPGGDRHEPLVEIGLVAAGLMDDTSLRAVERYRAEIDRQLSHEFSEFSWRISVIQRPGLNSVHRVEPVTLLDAAREERDAHEWDFVLIITAADLASHYKPFALMAVSRATDAAVISTSRIDPKTSEPETSAGQRMETLRERLTVLTLHALGHLNGLEHEQDERNLMFDVRSVDDLGALRDWNEAQRRQIGRNLREIADLRLEEKRTPRFILPFYLRSMWINRHEILNAVREAHPWEFPVRLTRLTTAAVSTAILLMMTAETWDVAHSQTLPRIFALWFATFAATTWYITFRQQLLVRRERRLSEQSVITNVSAVAVVICGMLTTFLVLLATVFVASLLLFRLSVVRRWTGAVETSTLFPDYALVATFIACLAIVVGALGASFEDHHYFRHVTFVDEET